MLLKGNCYCCFSSIITSCSCFNGLQNWDDHDRADRYLAQLNAQTYLESCDPNAIIFTIGDNDTFPLWYMQQVEGVRRDIKIVNTSLFKQIGTSIK